MSYSLSKHPRSKTQWVTFQINVKDFHIFKYVKYIMGILPLFLKMSSTTKYYNHNVELTILYEHSIMIQNLNTVYKLYSHLAKCPNWYNTKCLLYEIKLLLNHIIRVKNYKNVQVYEMLFLNSNTYINLPLSTYLPNISTNTYQYLIYLTTTFN